MSASVTWTIDSFEDEAKVFFTGSSIEDQALAHAQAVQARCFGGGPKWVFTVRIGERTFKVDTEVDTVTETTLERERTCPRCSRKHLGCSDQCIDCSGDDDATG